MQANLTNFRIVGENANTSVVWHNKDKTWLCGDNEGNIYKMPNKSSSFEKTVSCDNELTALAFKSTTNECVLGYGEQLNFCRYPDGINSTQSAGRRSLAISNLQYDNTGSFVIASSVEADIQIISTSDFTIDRTIPTHDTGVRTFATTSKTSYLAFVDVVGALKVHSLQFSTSAITAGRSVQSADLVFEKNSLLSRSILGDMSTGVKVAFHPSEERLVLAVPMPGSISFFVKEGENWNEKILVADPNGTHTHDERELNLVTFSPDGSHMASADVTGHVLVWQLNLADLTKSVPIKHITPSEGGPLIDLHFGQEEGDNYLLLLTNSSAAKVEGVVSTQSSRVYVPPKVVREKPVVMDISSPVKSPVKTTQSSSSQRVQSPAGSTIEPTVAAGSSRKRLSKAVESSKDDEDDDMLFDDIPPPPPKKDLVSAGVVAAVGVRNITEESSESIAEIKKAARPATSVFDDEAKGGKVVKDDDDEDEDEGYEDDDEDMVDPETGLTLTGFKNIAESKPVALLAQQVKLQPAFQPSSTRPDAQMRRYLAWNNVGSITSRDESIENRVEVRFTNTMGGNKNESFADRDTFVMAALAYEGAVFASEPEEDLNAEKDKDGFKKPLPGSVVYYHAFAGQKQLEGVNESFKYTLADSEGAVAVAVGRGWVAVATTSNLLRLFSSTGLQVKIIHLRGPVVTMVGMDSRLAIVYHGGVPLEETFQLRVDVLDINWREGCRAKVAVQGLHVPLTAKATLTWAGFDVDQLMLTVIDSAGIVSVLTRATLEITGWEWTPVLDTIKTRKSIDHVYWPVMVKGDKLAFILLNGESRPAVYPPPVVTVRPFKLPVVTMKESKEMGDSQREKLQNLLWEDTKTLHAEVLKEECSVFGASAASMDRYSDTVERVEAQQLATDKLILTLFQEACQQQRLPLALNLALKFRTEKALEAAIKVANHFGRTSVAQAVDAMLQQKQALTAEIESQQASQYGELNGGVDYTQSSSYGTGYGDDDQDVQVVEPVRGSLSSRVSANSLLPPTGSKSGSSSSSSSSYSKTVVSPPVPSSQEKPRNPFAVVSTGNTPAKRKNNFEGISELTKASPSPKKAALDRSSTFSQNARLAKNSDKTML